MIIELSPLLKKEQTDDEQLEVARRVKQFVHDDFVRVGAPPEVVRGFADPTDSQQVKDQLLRIRENKDARYLSISTDGQLQGVAKLGSWKKGDQQPFGGTHERASGLHVFSVAQGLAEAALTAIYLLESCPKYPLKAAVHDNDAELQEAFTTLGASADGRKGVITVGGYAAHYTLRTLDPLRTR
jgi:hypothetical protein